MVTKRNITMATILLGFVLIIIACNGKTDIPNHDKKVKVAVLVAEGFHDGEAYMPIGYLYNRGAKVTVIGIEPGEVKAYNSDFTIKIKKSVTDIKVDDFDALILPGGQAPSLLMANKDVVDFAKAFFETGKVTAAICHGPQILATADVLKGLNVTSFSGIQGEMLAAGAIFKDTTIVIDGNLITSRVPSDLSNFCKAIEKALFSD